MSTRNEADHRARLASEKIPDDAYRAADQLSVDAITDAAAKLRAIASPPRPEPPMTPPMRSRATSAPPPMPKRNNGTAITWRLSKDI